MPPGRSGRPRPAELAPAEPTEGRTTAAEATGVGRLAMDLIDTKHQEKTARVSSLAIDGNFSTLNELHNSGEWTDLETAVNSRKGPDGKTYYYTAMAWAASYKQLEVMRWLIEKGAKVNETRECHQLPSIAVCL